MDSRHRISNLPLARHDRAMGIPKRAARAPYFPDPRRKTWHDVPHRRPATSHAFHDSCELYYTLRRGYDPDPYPRPSFIIVGNHSTVSSYYLHKEQRMKFALAALLLVVP